MIDPFTFTSKEDDTKQMYNKWFAGYFPFHQPKYAMVIVNLDTGSKSGAVTPLYSQMATGIHAINQKRGTN